MGFILAPDAIMEKLVFAKQIADLHTSVLPQRIVHEFLRRDWLDPHIRLIVNAYRKRRDAMLAAMEEHFPPGVSWSRPEGGIFLWVTLPEGMDAYAMLDEALRGGYFSGGGNLKGVPLAVTKCYRIALETVPAGQGKSRRRIQTTAQQNYRPTLFGQFYPVQNRSFP